MLIFEPDRVLFLRVTYLQPCNYTYMKATLIHFFLFLTATIDCFGQHQNNDSLHIDYGTFYSHCLNGNVLAALELLNLDTNRLSQTDKTFSIQFRERFAYESDNSDFLKQHTSEIDPLFAIFHSYWRQALLNPSDSLDPVLENNLNRFLSRDLLQSDSAVIAPDSLDKWLSQYIQNHHVYSTNGLGKTGGLYDLLVWKTQKDTIYEFRVHREKISAKVVLMYDFVTLGWAEYVTLGKYYPGGWATDEALYCVASTYDLNSEDFLISYLAHEGRHFKDYQLFPKLKNSADLEYRAKLTELSMAETTLYDLLEFFINNANYDSDNGHRVANYCAIRDLSMELFKVPFEKDLNKWKELNPKRINKAAYKVLKKNTRILKKNAQTVEHLIN